MLRDDADLNGQFEAMRYSVLRGDEKFHPVMLAAKSVTLEHDDAE